MTFDWLIADVGRVNDVIFVGLQNSVKSVLTEPGLSVVKCRSVILIATALKLGLLNFVI